MGKKPPVTFALVMTVPSTPFRFLRYQKQSDIDILTHLGVKAPQSIRVLDGVRFHEAAGRGGEVCRDMYGDLPYGTFSVPDVVIRGEAGYIFTSEGTPLTEQNAGFLRQKKFPRHRFEDVSGQRVADEVVIDEAVSLISKCDAIFWHWMTDSLPKVLLAEESGFRGGYILPSPSDAPFAQESVQLLGVSSHRILCADARDVRVRRLHIPAYFCGYNAHHNLPFARSFRDAVRLAVGGLEVQRRRDSTRRRIFVARRKTSKIRSVRNQDDVRTVLDRFGFETIYFEDLSLKEQILIAQESEIMVAPHGSGATHSLFMDSGSWLIELFPHKRRKSCDCFESLSVIGKNHYVPLESELPDDGDIDVNCTALQNVLERAVGMRREGNDCAAISYMSVS